MSFDQGKFDLFQGLVKAASEGYSVAEVQVELADVLSAELEKTASEADIDHKLGLESMAHTFLKVASEVYAEYDLSESTDEEVLDYILEKIAEDEDEKSEKKMSTGKKVGLGLAGVGALAGLAAGARGGQHALRNRRLAQSSPYHDGGLSGNLRAARAGLAADARGAGARLRSGASSIADKVKSPFRKKASADELPEDLENALAILEEYGLLED